MPENSDRLGMPSGTTPAPSVLFVVPWHPDVIGGVNNVVINLHRRLLPVAGLRPILLVNKYPQRTVNRSDSNSLGPVYEFYIQAPLIEGKAIKSFLSSLARVWNLLPQFIRFLRQENVRAVNLHFPSLCAATVLLARQFTRHEFCVILSFHGADLPPVLSCAPVHRWLWQVVLARCDAIVMCSQALLTRLVQAYPDCVAKVHCIHNGIDVDDCLRNARDAGLPAELKGRRYIISVGKFERKKGQDTLLESFRQVSARVGDIDLVLFGRTGPALSEVRRVASEEMIRDRVHIRTDVPHPQTLAAIASAALFVLPSREEPFGIVFLEAGMLGTTVVATNVGGIPEIIEDGRTGLLVPPDSPSKLADAICQLLDDTERSRAYAQGLRAAVRSRFTVDRVVREYARLVASSKMPQPR